MKQKNNSIISGNPAYDQIDRTILDIPLKTGLRKSLWIAFGVAFVSILLTPILTRLSDGIYDRTAKYIPRGVVGFFDVTPSVGN